MKEKQLKKNITKQVIGRYDKVDLPEMGLFDIDAKVDTGAYTSALNCSHIKVINDDDEPRLQFIVLDNSHPAYNKKLFEVTEFTKCRVRNSFGQEEERYIITTTMMIFGKPYETEFTLSYRASLKFPILLGRKFLRQGYIVNVNRYNLSYKCKTRENENSNIVEESGIIFNQKIGGNSGKERT